MKTARFFQFGTIAFLAGFTYHHLFWGVWHLVTSLELWGFFKGYYFEAFVMALFGFIGGSVGYVYQWYEDKIDEEQQELERHLIE